MDRRSTVRLWSPGTARTRFRKRRNSRATGALSTVSTVLVLSSTVLGTVLSIHLYHIYTTEVLDLLVS